MYVYIYIHIMYTNICVYDILHLYGLYTGYKPLTTWVQFHVTKKNGEIWGNMALWSAKIYEEKHGLVSAPVSLFTPKRSIYDRRMRLKRGNSGKTCVQILGFSQESRGGISADEPKQYNQHILVFYGVFRDSWII